MAGIIIETRTIRSEGLEGQYLRPFNMRELSELMKMQKGMLTFQVECLYKNLNDPTGINDLGSLMELQSNFSPFERFKNFPLHVTEFYEHTLESTILSPAAVFWIQMILS